MKLRTAVRLMLFLPVLALSIVWGADNLALKPSTYAPIQDVVAQIDGYLKQLTTDISAEAGYGDDQKSRVAKDANTLIVLAQVLGNHDAEHAKKGSAAALLAASQKLADGADQLEKAKAALQEVKQAWEAGSETGGQVSWEPVANLQELMKQVPIVNNRLRSGVTGRRFERTIEQNAGLATTLAAIAQASMHDTDYCTGKDEEAQWAKICAEMRDAAASVQTAVRMKDQKTATAALAKLVKTCDDCHHDFRD